MNTVEPFRSATKSSMVGIKCFSRLTALLASRISIHIRTSPDFFGTTMMGLIHGVGPSTFLMMSNSSSRLSSLSTSERTWKGIRRWGCCLGETSGSMCNLTVLPVSFPIPEKRHSNSGGYWSVYGKWWVVVLIVTWSKESWQAVE